MDLKNRAFQLLRKSDQFFKTDMVYLTKGSFWITFGQAASNVLSLLLVIAFANLLSKETYGIYRYILSLAAVMNIFSLTGMNSAVAKTVATGNEGAFKASVFYQLKWNLLMLAAFFVLSGYYFINGDLLFATSFLILGLFVPSTLALNTYGAYLEGRREFKLANISTVFSTFIYAVGMFVAILLSGEVLWLIIVYALTTFASTLFFYFFILHKFKPPKAASLETLTYGRKLTFIGFTEIATAQIDKIILAHYWGPAQLAVYSLAMAIPARLMSFIKILVGLGSPKFAIKTPAELNTVFYKRIFQGMSIGLIISLLYILFSPYLFKYLLPKYLDAVFYSQILSLSLIFAMPNRYMSLLFVSQEFSGVILKNSLFQSAVKIALYLTLGIMGGIMGLVLAFVIMSFIGLLMNIFMWRKNTSIQSNS